MPWPPPSFVVLAASTVPRSVDVKISCRKRACHWVTQPRGALQPGAGGPLRAVAQQGRAVAWVAREPGSFSRDSHETGTRHETLSESVSRHTTPVTESCGVAFRHESRERHGTSVGGWSRCERKYYSAKYYSPRSWHRGSGGYDGGRRTKAIEWS